LLTHEKSAFFCDDIDSVELAVVDPEQKGIVSISIDRRPVTRDYGEFLQREKNYQMEQ
jgi:hypothetical protein